MDEFDDNMTVSCWTFFHKRKGERQGGYAFEVGGGTGLGLRSSDQRLIVYTRDGRVAGPIARAFSGSPFTQWDSWVQIGFTYDNETLVLYFNGKPAMSRIVGPDYHKSQVHPKRWETSMGREFVGKLDDIRIYNRALSAEEVKALYDLEKPKGK